MTNAVNRDAICNCLFRYLSQCKDSCDRTDVVNKIANIIGKYVTVDVFSTEDIHLRTLLPIITVVVPSK